MQSLALQLRALSLHSGGLVRATLHHRVNIGEAGLACQARSNLLQKDAKFASPILVQSASMSFFNQQSANDIWSSMSGVSSQGKKRGRARGLLRYKNLNRGQIIGMGKKKIDFPGLTSPTVNMSGDGPAVNKIGQISEESFKSYEENIDEIRRGAGGRKSKFKKNPLERGWTGSKPAGKKFGAPVSANPELKFENFDSVLLEFKTVFHMAGNFGRVRRTSCLMVAGNKNGTVGYSLTSGKHGKNVKTFMNARNRAGLRLVNVERYEDRTVFHDFFTQYGKTRIFVEQRPFGYGIIAHRAIKAICEMVGIKDIYAKVEGSVAVQSITKAFLLGLMRQRTHQAMADEKQLHLIEMRPEEDYYPRLIASPSDGKVRTKEEIEHNEILDFQLICFEGNLASPHFSRKNPYEGQPQWDLHLRRAWARESHERVKLRMSVEEAEDDGFYKSHLTAKYPECRTHKVYIRKRENTN